MDKNDIHKMIIDMMRAENKSPVLLPERNELLLYLHGLTLFTGRIDILYCNSFLTEAVQLLSNSIFLYEEGLFDCAFYSVRQAAEVVNSMLYLSINDQGTLDKWSAKGHFPMDSKIKEQLKKLSINYCEICSLIPEFFDHHTELIRRSHKVVHKQGFDTFYRNRNYCPDEIGFSQEDETELFIESLKYTIGIVLVVLLS